MSDYIKLAEAPTLVLQSPLCSACTTELLSEDGWLCPVCGTSWSYGDGDGDTGELYESWSGETLDTEPVDDDRAADAGFQYEREQRNALLARLGLSR